MLGNGRTRPGTTKLQNQQPSVSFCCDHFSQYIFQSKTVVFCFYFFIMEMACRTGDNSSVATSVNTGLLEKRKNICAERN